MAIHTRRHTYDPGEPLTPWVHAIARYKLIDHLRRTRASVADLPIDDAEEVMAHDDHIDMESAYDLSKLLGQLPDKMRRAIECVKDRRPVRDRGGGPLRHVGIGGESQRASRVEGPDGADRAGEEHMKTDDLIAMLSTNVEPVARRQVVRTLGAAVAIGAAVAVVGVILALGIRADLAQASALASLRHEARLHPGNPGSRVGLPDQAGTSWRRATNAARIIRAAIRRHHAPCCGQPRLGPELPLERDDRRRPMARMSHIHSAHRRRAVCRDRLGGAADGADRPCAHGRDRRSRRRLSERDRLRSSLRRRFRTVRRHLVRRNHRPMHHCRLEARAADTALVMFAFETATQPAEPVVRITPGVVLPTNCNRLSLRSELINDNAQNALSNRHGAKR